MHGGSSLEIPRLVIDRGDGKIKARINTVVPTTASFQSYDPLELSSSSPPCRVPPLRTWDERIAWYILYLYLFEDKLGW